jgi:UDP-N-acetylmuramate dehydrogenase
MVSLQPLHTFGTSNFCEKVINIYSEQDVFDFLSKDDEKPYMILGGGSNVLFTKNFDGNVLLNKIKGIEIIDEDDDAVLVKVGAGEQWHQFVMWCVAHKLWGLENLSLIPGSIGAAPMQNIGAYGVEQDACFHSLNAIDMQSGTSAIFFKHSCKFGYRESIFKRECKNQYIITHVTYLLSKHPKPVLNYADVAQQVGEEHSANIKKISDTIISIRQAKLPNPEVVGNAGSFFKNPIVSKNILDILIEKYPTIVSYPIDNEQVKLAAGWLIDQCGFKGIKEGNTGTYKNQALVLINHGGASGEEIFAFAQKIQAAVIDKFSITLEMEVNLI